MSASSRPTRKPWLRERHGEVRRDRRLAEPPREAMAMTRAMSPAELVVLGSGRGAAPPPLTTTSTSAAGNSRRSASLDGLLDLHGEGIAPLRGNAARRSPCPPLRLRVPRIRSPPDRVPFPDVRSRRAASLILFFHTIHFGPCVGPSGEGVFRSGRGPCGILECARNRAADESIRKYNGFFLFLVAIFA